MNKVKLLFVELLLRLFPGLVTSKMMTSYLKSKGISVGEGTTFFNAGTVNVDVSRPLLISIGAYCKITEGVVILGHDYSRSVLRRVYGDIVGEARKTIVGDNVFIGMNSIILMGTKIGNNCIVGAGSICRGEFPDNSVIAGNPARVICSLEDYYNKRKCVYVDEAKEYVELFIERYGRKPTINEMGAFFPLYLERDIEMIHKHNLRTKLSGDNEDEIISSFLNSEPLYPSFEDFLNGIK